MYDAVYVCLDQLQIQSDIQLTHINISIHSHSDLYIIFRATHMQIQLSDSDSYLRSQIHSHA